MGCVYYIWNAKNREGKEQRVILAKEGKYHLSHKTYSQYKIKYKTPWLFDVGSVLLPNTTNNWYNTYQNFFKKVCGRPKHKNKD